MEAIRRITLKDWIKDLFRTQEEREDKAYKIVRTTENKKFMEEVKTNMTELLVDVDSRDLKTNYKLIREHLEYKISNSENSYIEFEDATYVNHHNIDTTELGEYAYFNPNGNDKVKVLYLCLFKDELIFTTLKEFAKDKVYIPYTYVYYEKASRYTTNRTKLNENNKKMKSKLLEELSSPRYDLDLMLQTLRIDKKKK